MKKIFALLLFIIITLPVYLRAQSIDGSWTLLTVEMCDSSMVSGTETRRVLEKEEVAGMGEIVYSLNLKQDECFLNGQKFSYSIIQGKFNIFVNVAQQAPINNMEQQNMPVVSAPVSMGRSYDYKYENNQITLTWSYFTNKGEPVKTKITMYLQKTN